MADKSIASNENAEFVSHMIPLIEKVATEGDCAVERHSAGSDALIELRSRLTGEIEAVKVLDLDEFPSDPFDLIPTYATFILALNDEKWNSNAYSEAAEVVSGVALNAVLEDYRKLPVELQHQGDVDAALATHVDLVEYARELMTACSQDWYKVDREAHNSFSTRKAYYELAAQKLTAAVLRHRRSTQA